MDRRGKTILAVVLVLVAAVLVWPRLPFARNNVTEFKVTERPAQALQAARTAGRPVFLEFYARW
ncbi:hypothetical protein SY88_15160 [Clostridiales bacterium PH28_bin88]|nr:hypothetical protein SY88_15160 [Clostridiales bacterium PH28_bin88]